MSLSAADWMYRAYWLQHEQLYAMLKLVDTKEGGGISSVLTHTCL